jgi:hypothetical protein
MQVGRCSYFVPTNYSKANGEKLSQEDFLNIGYMAGRFGINLDGNPEQNYKPQVSNDGLVLNINCCTADLFEKNLEEAGITFSVLA